MKIGLYISDILFRTGGTEANTAYIINALQRIYNNSSISIVSEKYVSAQNYEHINIGERFNFLFGSEIISKNIELILIFSQKNNFLNRASFERKLRKKSKEFDIFINCSMNYYTFLAKKNIVIVHFPPYKKIHSNFVKKYPLFFPVALYKDYKWFSSYDIYISYSQYSQNWLDKIWHIDKERSSLIDPAVSFIKTSGEEKLDCIMICSRIEPSKEIELLVKTFLSNQMLRQTAKLYIVGAVIDENIAYINKIKKIISNYTDAVYLIENPNRNEIEKYYNLSKIFWHAKGYSCDENTKPAELEHFGLTTVEAMSAGCVPVVINKGGQKEIISDGVNGFLWDTPEELIEKTITLLQSPEKYQMMSKAAKETIGKYSFDEFTKNLHMLLEQAL
jgi:glycosyltransferase involved in cell wall biosynthesis